MTDEGVTQTSQNLTDEEILKRADMINEARKLEQIEKERQLEAEKAQRAAEAERIRKEQEAEEAAKLAEANRIKQEEEAKKAEELRRAHELVDAEEAAKPKKKKHTAAKIIVSIIIILLIICGIAIVSSSVTSTPAPLSTSLPFQAHYTMWLPQGTTNIAGTSISLVGDSNKMMVTMPGMATETLTQGQTLTAGPFKLTLSLFWGAWNVYDITGKAQLTYKGISTDNLVTFDTILNTDKEIPKFLFNLYMSLAGIKYESA